MMKQGRTLPELAAELERQNSGKRDFVADTRSIDMETPEPQEGEEGDRSRLHLHGINGGERFPVTPHAHGQIAARLAIPKPYYDRMRQDAPGLFDRNVNHWLRENPKKQMVRTLDGNARAYLSDRYRPIDNHQIMEACLPVLYEVPDLQPVSMEVTENRLYFKAVFPKMEGEAKVGDPVQAGIQISNSEIGAGTMSVSPLLYRLVCLNGMVRADFGQQRRHVGKHTGNGGEGAQIFYQDETRRQDDKALMMKLRDVVRGVATRETFQAMLQGIQDAAGQQITGEIQRTVELTAKRYALSDTEQDSALKALINGADLTRWGLANAITRISQDSESYDRASELERVGGDIIELDRKDWEVMAAAA